VVVVSVKTGMVVVVSVKTGNVEVTSTGTSTGTSVVEVNVVVSVCMNSVGLVVDSSCIAELVSTVKVVVVSVEICSLVADLLQLPLDGLKSLVTLSSVLLSFNGVLLLSTSLTGVVLLMTDLVPLTSLVGIVVVDSSKVLVGVLVIDFLTD